MPTHTYSVGSFKRSLTTKLLVTATHATYLQTDPPHIKIVKNEDVHNNCGFFEPVIHQWHKWKKPSRIRDHSYIT